MSEKQIIVQQPPIGAILPPRVDFNKNDFDKLIWDKGYDVYWEKAILCPCKSQNSNHQSNCQNCGGWGYTFLDRVKTRMVLHSMKYDIQHKEWSETAVGSVSITSRDIDLISYMDKITLEDGEVEYYEVLFPKVYKGVLFAHTIYDVKRTYYVCRFQGTDKPYVQIKEGEDFTVDRNFLKFNDSFKKFKDLSIAIRYIHRPQYHVIDLARRAMNTNVIKDGKEVSIKMPIHGIGRPIHVQMDAQNLSCDKLFDNSFLDECELKDINQQNENTCGT